MHLLLLLLLGASLSVVSLQVLVLLQQATTDDINDDVSLAHIDEHIVFESNRVLLTHKDAVSDSQIFDQVLAHVWVVHDLEVTATVLLSCLLVLAWNHEVVYHSFLKPRETR